MLRNCVHEPSHLILLCDPVILTFELQNLIRPITWYVASLVELDQGTAENRARKNSGCSNLRSWANLHAKTPSEGVEMR